MAKKSGTGLANWAQKKRGSAEDAPASDITETETLPRRRAKGETVAITVRLSRTQWERLHELAVHEGDSLQGLAMRGFSKLLEEKGLKGL